MATEFTVKGRQNVTVELESQASTSISSTIGGESATFTIINPSKFKTPVVGDAIELSDILETVDIRYVASTAGYSNGDAVNSWTNSGDLDGYDLQNESLDTTVHPTFDTDDANNPFSTGAMKFVISDSDYNSDYLYWGTNDTRKTLSPEGAFTFYMVMATTSADARKGHFPLWVQGNVGQAAEKSQTAIDAFVSGANQIRTRLKGSEFGAVDVDVIANTTIDDDKYGSSGIDDGVVIVVTVDADGNMRSYNSNAKQSTEATIDSSRSFKADTFGGPDGKAGLLPNDKTTGDTLYLAEFGYWGSKLEGQQAATLGRLLGDKYQIS